MPLDELPPLSFALDGPTTIYDQDCYDLSRSLHGRSISDAKDALLQPDGPCAGRRFSEAPCSVFDIDVADRFFFGAEMIHLDDGEEPQDEYGFEVQLSNGDEVWAAGHSVPYQDSPGEAYNCFFDSGASSAPPSTVFVGR